MNRISWLLLATATAVFSAFSQTVIERGPHTSVVETKREVTDGDQTNFVTSRYTILQSGLNYFSSEEGVWKETSTQIDLDEAGAVYRRGPFNLRFAPNYNTPNGAVTVTMPGGEHLKLQTVGIALTRGNGDSLWIGEIQNSNGILDGNTVAYPDAFAGAKADIIVRVSVGKFESDVVLREQIVTPQELGWDPQDTKLEIWHKVVQAPEAESRFGHINRASGHVDVDEQVLFNSTTNRGVFFIGEGAAFLTVTSTNPAFAFPNRVAVAKERFNDTETQQQYLIESIPYSEVAATLQTLPAREEAAIDPDKLKRALDQRRMLASIVRSTAAQDSQANAPRRKIDMARFATSERRIGVPAKAFAWQKDTLIAAADHIAKRGLPDHEGFAIDYTFLVSATNFRFAGDTTYYVTNSVFLRGAVTIEGGTVVKFSPYTNFTPVINIYDGIKCLTTPYAPAVFTSYSDNSVGDVIDTNALSGWYAFYNLWVQSSNTNSMDLHDISFRYASAGISLEGTNTHRLSNISSIGCGYGLRAANNTTYVQNYLSYSNTVAAFRAVSATFHAEHVTAHVGDRLFTFGTSGALNLTNSLVVGMTNSSPGVTSDHVTTVASEAGVFQRVGAGAHYLPESSVYRNAGTTGLSSNMLGILNRTTTCAPAELSGTVSISTTLTPQVQRDNDIPDLGYHYYPLDYLWGNLTVAADTTLLLTNGVAVGLHSANSTILQSGSTFASEGMPHLMNRFVRYQTVQEQSSIYGTTSGNMTLLSISNSPTIKPKIFLRFTEVTVGANLSSCRSLCNSTEFGSIALRDCHLLNLCDSYNPASGFCAYGVTNNILERCDLSFVRSNNLHQMTVDLRNNYASRSVLVFSYPTNTSSPPSWTIKDNLFDTVTLTATGSPTYLVCSYNGYYATAIPSISAGSDKLPAGLDFQYGPLGNYYYPGTNTPSSTKLWALVDAGSCLQSDASLSSYTTRIDQAKDVSSVDIGFHYVALDANGVPLDSDGDDIPDYLEDRNGNGVADSGESAWDSALNNSSGLTVYTLLQP